MGEFITELFRAKPYKPNQGRITRQVTFGAIAVTIVLGLWQLSDGLRGVDFGIRSRLFAQHAGQARIVSAKDTRLLLVVDEPLEKHPIAPEVQPNVKSNQQVQPGTLLLPGVSASHAGQVKFDTEKGSRLLLVVGPPLEEHQIPIGANPAVEQNQKVKPNTLLMEWRNPWVGTAVRYGIPGLLLLVGLWIDYRAVNVPTFADFLVAVEAEMNKVSWPTRNELFRASLVVLFTIFFLATVLYAFDWFWRIVFRTLGIFG